MLEMDFRLKVWSISRTLRIGFPFSRVVVRLGELDLDTDVNDGATPVDVPVEKSLPHLRYNPQLMVNDIALLKLKYAVTFNSECLIWVCVSERRLSDVVGR